MVSASRQPRHSKLFNSRCPANAGMLRTQRIGCSQRGHLGRRSDMAEQRPQKAPAGYSGMAPTDYPSRTNEVTRPFASFRSQSLQPQPGRHRLEAPPRRTNPTRAIAGSSCRCVEGSSAPSGPILGCFLRSIFRSTAHEGNHQGRAVATDQTAARDDLRDAA